MRRLSVPFALFVLFSLGCGIFGKPGDTDDTNVDTNDDDTTEPLEQSRECEDYLECVSHADPDSFDDLEEKYGPEGDCWTDDQDAADDCTADCLDAVEDLARDNPTENGCEDYAPDYAIDEGTLAFELTIVSDDCGIEGAVGNPWMMDGTVENDVPHAEFTIELTDGANEIVLECTNDGRDFDCASDDATGIPTTATGTASSDHQRAQGDWEITFGTECSSSGTFLAEME
jgi:hypothetical protein